MIIKKVSRELLVALSLTLSICTVSALAREPAQNQEQKQSGIQEEASKPALKPLAIIVPKPPQSDEAAKQAGESSENHTVIPPQPVIIKKNPNTIVIPVDEPVASSEFEPFSPARYESR
ncbi:MAG TPA: hypothetical protein VKC34_02825, partial [Blastocatellia bacterium]|nr:hypothetical protein [Blastocatellia bacterium]